MHAVNFNIRFYPQCLESRERVAAGALGAVHLVTGGYLQDWLLLDTDWNWRLDPAEGGELRAVGDIGSHWIDLLQFVTGRRVEAVMADLATFVPVRQAPVGPVETFCRGRRGRDASRARWRPRTSRGMLLRLEGGARGRESVSQVSAGRQNACSFEIDGADGRARLDLRAPRGALARPPRAPERDPAARPGADVRVAGAASALPAGHLEGFPDTFSELYRAVYRAVLAGGPPDAPDYPTFADGHDEAVIAEASRPAPARAAGSTVDRTPSLQEATV